MMEKKKPDFIFLSDGLRKVQNEGFTKFTVRIAQELQKYGVTVFGYGESDSPVMDHYIPDVRKKSDYMQILSRKEKYVLWAPWFLDRWTAWLMLLLKLRGKRCGIMLIYHPPVSKTYDRLQRIMLSMFKPDVYLASEDVYQEYKTWYRGKTYRLHAAVDGEKFHPVTPERKRELREKYKLPQDKTIFFHAGHLIMYRRLEWMAELPEDCEAVLASSNFHKPYLPTKEKLEARDNVMILNENYPHIEELFQASDVYVFTPAPEGAINIPLSVFEAMACNLYVVSTRHGELQAVEEGNGLLYTDGNDPRETARKAVALFKEQPPCHTRDKVMIYDWQQAAKRLVDWNSQN